MDDLDANPAPLEPVGVVAILREMGGEEGDKNE
jgi:hypothetical protein